MGCLTSFIKEIQNDNRRERRLHVDLYSLILLMKRERERWGGRGMIPPTVPHKQSTLATFSSLSLPKGPLEPILSHSLMQSGI